MSLSSMIRKKISIPLSLQKEKSPRLKYMRQMMRSQYCSCEMLQDIQMDKIKETIRHAFTTTDYYKKKFDDCGIHPDDIVDYGDIKKIPFLTKSDIKENTNDMISKQYQKERLIPFKTGGSTGKSITVFWDVEAMEMGIGAAYRSFIWAGWDIGEPWGRVWGNPPANISFKQKLRNILLQPVIYLDTIRLDDASMFEFISRWKITKPTLLHGHAHSLYLFSKFCKKHSINEIRPHGIISTSMMLMSHEREVIEDVFKCRVTDLYGCEEVGLIACECEKHAGMHINCENIYLELVDSNGNEVPSGNDGAIVVTSLINKAMPIIRYKVEDVGVFSRDRCSCGRVLPLLEKVTGRVADFLVRKDGSVVAGISLIERTLTAIPGIEQMQIIQKEVDDFVINLVPGKLFNNARANELVGEMKRTFGDEIKIHIISKKRIDPEPSGKYRFSISNVKNILKK